MADYNVYFTADLHINHLGILRHQKERVKAMSLADSNDIENHDKYIIDMWLEQTKRNDHVYILGDVLFGGSDIASKILHKLKSNGCKIYLVVGNHDKSVQKMTNMFESIDLIKEVKFKKENFDFLEDDFWLTLCHYPMKSWNHKCRGAMQLYGHVHNNSPWIDDSDDLCLNVGIDNPICNYKLFSLEQVYAIYKEKLKGFKPMKYSDEIIKENNFYVR